ncbi:hypothetical protein LCGC14_1779400 [marine sediment metagenome]|uniref:Uncharacterized protein n=1 Tax=marine sediment metagenome TaxID=412755 RepID=A0A0F9HIG4_9ZZZZ
MVLIQEKDTQKEDIQTITIPFDFFEHLLNCLANQKYIHLDHLPNGVEEINQEIIDLAWSDGMAMRQYYSKNF